MRNILSVNWRIVRLVGSQAQKNLLVNPGLYTTLSLGLIVLLLILRNSLGVISSGYLTVIVEPFLSPLIVMCLLSGLYMALVAGFSIVREKEMGTLEVIFCGPVSHLDYILGKYFAHVAGYIELVMIFLLACVILEFITNLVVSPLLLLIALLSVATAMGLIGLGSLIATIMRTIRGTLFLFIGLMFAILAIEVGQVILTSIVASGNFVGLIVLRDTVEVLSKVLAWFSPVSYLLNGADAVMRHNWLEWLGNIAMALVYGGATIILSTVLLRRKGVLR